MVDSPATSGRENAASEGSVSELLPQTLSWGLWLGEPKTVELIQVRKVLEVEVAV